MILEYLPPWIILALPELALVTVGVIIEWHYVSRITVFTNAMALAAHTASLAEPSTIFTTYVEIGVLMGIYGLYKYVREESIGRAFYVPAYYLYSSLPVGFIIFLPVTDFGAILLATIVHLGMVIHRGRVSSWVYSGPRPFEVTHFLQQEVIRYPNHKIGRWVEVRLSDVFD